MGKKRKHDGISQNGNTEQSSATKIAHELDPLEKSVLKVHTTFIENDYTQPWAPPNSHRCTGSSYVISGQRIVTNAHVIANQTFVELTISGESTHYKAKVLAVGHDCDLALLGCDDPELWSKVSPLKIGEVPNLEDEVRVYGYPAGGDRFCTTKGVVSRIEQDYVCHSGIEQLTIQVDAAINSGNSGGPALSDGVVVGTVFQGYDSLQNTGYIIPANVVNRFLLDCEKNNYKYQGYPGLDISTQTMQNVDLRQFYKMEDRTGILITRVGKISAAQSLLKRQDVILEVNGHVVGNDGTINTDFSKGIAYQHLLNMSFVGQIVNMKILRDGAEKDISIPLKYLINQNSLFDRKSYGQRPSYYIASGVVFQPLGNDYIQDAWGGGSIFDCSSMPEDIAQLTTRSKKFHGQEKVIINKILASEHTSGYLHIEDVLVKKINGIKINSFKDAIAALDANAEPHHHIVLSDGEHLVLKNMSREEHAALLKQYSIPSAHSSDLDELLAQHQSQQQGKQASQLDEMLLGSQDTHGSYVSSDEEKSIEPLVKQPLLNPSEDRPIQSHASSAASSSFSPLFSSHDSSSRQSKQKALNSFKEIDQSAYDEIMYNESDDEDYYPSQTSEAIKCTSTQ